MYKFNRGKRKDFKTETAYLKDVFARNKEKLTQVFGVNAESKFINNVQARKKIEGITVTKALNQLGNTEGFTPYVDRAAESVRQALIKHGMYKDFQYLTRKEKGQFSKWDRSKLKYDKDTGLYIYDGRVSIDIRNSPETIVLSVIG